MRIEAMPRYWRYQLVMKISQLHIRLHGPGPLRSCQQCRDLVAPSPLPKDGPASFDPLRTLP